MTDITTEIRENHEPFDGVCDECDCDWPCASIRAAHKIEQLQAALKPLADIPLWRDTYPDGKYDDTFVSARIAGERVLAARAALEHTGIGSENRPEANSQPNPNQSGDEKC